MKIDRSLGILNILVNTDRITIKELAERFEVSKRTVFRDHNEGRLSTLKIYFTSLHL